jgi:hypothetical protein
MEITVLDAMPLDATGTVDRVGLKRRAEHLFQPDPVTD